MGNDINNTSTKIARAVGYNIFRPNSVFSFAGGIDKQNYVWTVAHNITELARAELGRIPSIEEQLGIMARVGVKPVGPLFINSKGLIDGAIKIPRKALLGDNTRENSATDMPLIDSWAYNATPQSIQESFFIPTAPCNPRTSRHKTQFSLTAKPAEIINSNTCELGQKGNLVKGDSGTIIYNRNRPSQALGILMAQDLNYTGVYFLRLDPDYYRRNNPDIASDPLIRIANGKAQMATLPTSCRFVNPNLVRQYLISSSSQAENTQFASSQEDKFTKTS